MTADTDYESVIHDVFPIQWTGDDLRKMRLLLGLRQEDIANMIGVSKCTVSHIETGATTHPLTIFGYAVLLERCYASVNGYLPSYRKIGTSNHITEGDLHERRKEHSARIFS